MEDWYYLILRLLHVTLAIFWSGSVIYMAWFILPAVTAAGPEGGKFMQQLTQTRNMPKVLTLAGLLSLVTGILLFWRISRGLQSEFLASISGIGYMVALLATLTAFLIGFLINRVNAERLGKLGQSIAASGEPPNADQTALMAMYRAKLKSGIENVAYLLALTIVIMSVVKYL